MMPVRAIAVVLLVAAGTGCASFDNLFVMTTGTRRARVNAPAWMYEGPECKQVVPGPNFIFARVQTNLPRQQQVLSLVCLPRFDRDLDARSAYGHAAFPELHQRFPDRQGDPVLAAVMVSECYRGGFCGTNGDEAAAGMMAFYADLYDAGSLKAALAPMPLPEGAKASFLRLALEANQAVKARADALDPRIAAIFRELPKRTWTERRALFQPYAALYADLDRAVAELPGVVHDRPALEAKLEELDRLRERFLAACGDYACRMHPFFTDATVAMVEAQVTGGLMLDADATARFLLQRDTHADTLSAAVSSRQYERVASLKAQREAWAQASKTNMSEAMLRARFPEGEPLFVSETRVWPARADFAWLAPMLSKKPPSSGDGKVKRLVTLKGGTVRVEFQDVIERYSDQSCRNVGRPIRYDFDRDRNSVIPVYDQVCSKPRYSYEKREVSPITLPARQARRLKPGVQIAFIADATSGEGRVLEVTQGGRVTALGPLATPVKGSEIRVSTSR